MKEIGVITSCIMDLTFEVPELPRPGQTVSTENFHTGYGGKGANQAVAAGRTGGEVRVIGAVGSDDFGRGTIENFEENGIDAEYIFQTEDTGTGLAAIYVNESGENAIGVAPRANLSLGPEQLAKIPDSWFDLEIIAGVNEVHPEVLITGFRRARENGGVTTVYNAAPAKEVPEKLWELTDILIVNETEAEFYCGRLPDWEQPEPALEALSEKGAETIILTLGKSGAVVYTENELTKVPGQEVETVDTTGAGDAFIGRYLSALGTGKNQPEAVRTANEYAARSVQGPGTQKSFPTL